MEAMDGKEPVSVPSSWMCCRAASSAGGRKISKNWQAQFHRSLFSCSPQAISSVTHLELDFVLSDLSTACRGNAGFPPFKLWYVFYLTAIVRLPKNCDITASETSSILLNSLPNLHDSIFIHACF